MADPHHRPRGCLSKPSSGAGQVPATLRPYRYVTGAVDQSFDDPEDLTNASATYRLTRRNPRTGLRLGGFRTALGGRGAARDPSP
jgi:hypothetical protein